MLKQYIKKNKVIHGKKYLICLLPSTIMLLSYVYLMYQITKSIDIVSMLLPFINMPNKGFDYWFPALNLSVIVSIIILIGLFMWLIYLTFYDNKIRVWKILLVNIITPIYVIFLYFEIGLQFSK
jgi:hypothetical protein